MLAWGVRRRFFYLLTVAVIFAVVAVGLIWWLNPEPTCFDGRQNQNELGVDCGGICERVCMAEVKSLRVVWTRVLPVTTGQYDVATLVVNPNRLYRATQFNYIVRLIDEQGILITTRQGQAHLNSGESFVIYNSRLNVGQRQPSRAVLEIIGEPTWQRTDSEEPVVSLRQKSFANQPFPNLVAEVKNDSLTDLRNVEVVALLSDSQGNAYAVSSTVIDLLAGGASTEAAFTWPEPFLIEQPVINFYTHLSLATE